MKTIEEIEREFLQINKDERGLLKPILSPYDFIRFFRTHLEERDRDILILKGHLGYSVPGDIPVNPISSGEYVKCGLCEAKDNQNADLQAKLEEESLKRAEVETLLGKAGGALEKARCHCRQTLKIDQPGKEKIVCNRCKVLMEIKKQYPKPVFITNHQGRVRNYKPSELNPIK